MTLDGNLITARNEYEVTWGPENTRSLRSEVYWAVAHPSSTEVDLDSDGNPIGDTQVSDPVYYVNGGMPVTVFDLNDIKGLRLLLDAIERNINGTTDAG